jgi:hypothetical protein
MVSLKACRREDSRKYVVGSRQGGEASRKYVVGSREGEEKKSLPTTYCLLPTKKTQPAERKSLPTTYCLLSTKKTQTAERKSCYLLPNEQGIALVIALMISLAVMVLIISTLYFVTQSTSMSGAGKRYATASEAADGAVEVMKDAVNLILVGEPVDSLPIADNDPPCLLNAVFSDDQSCTTTLTLPGTVGDFNASIVIMRLYSSPIPGGRIEFARAGGGAPTTAIYYRINTIVTGKGGTRAETSALYRYSG